MICPVCKGRTVIVDNQGKGKRRRECKECGTRFTTETKEYRLKSIESCIEESIVRGF